MRKSVKTGMAALALIAPLAIGWTIAAGASVGNLIGDPAHHTIDVFAVDGYLVEREDIDGTVTETVTGPDGSMVDPADVPPNVAAEIASWTPGPAPVTFTVDENGACYALVENVEGDGDWDLVETGDGGTLVARGGDDAAVEAVYSENELADSVVSSHVDSGAPLDELPGAEPIEACGS